MIKINVKSINIDVRNRSFSLGSNSARVVILITLILILTGCTSANLGKKKAEDRVELTERQISILEQENLPADYEKLTDSQKKSIMAMEELLVYLEDKYDVSFSYAAYYAGSVLEPEHLSARVENGGKKDIVTVTRKYSDEGEVSISDDYPSVAARGIYRTFLNDKMDEMVGSENHFIILGSAYNPSGKNAKSVEELREIDFSISQNIFLKESSLATTLKEFSMVLRSWLENEGIGGESRLFLLKEEDFVQLNEENFSKFQLKGAALERESIILD